MILKPEGAIRRYSQGILEVGSQPIGLCDSNHICPLNAPELLSFRYCPNPALTIHGQRLAPPHSGLWAILGIPGTA